MLEPFMPLIDHQVISIQGRSPMLLLGFEAAAPEPVEIALAIDLSDSCGELSKVFAQTKKLLRQLPSDWPVTIFSLSSPQAISRYGLRLHDLSEAEDWLKELCVDTNVFRVCKRMGSFLRPVLESIAASNGLSRRLLIVLTDGRLSDFGDLNVPANLEVVCIVSNADHTESRLRRPNLGQVKILETRDVQLERVIARYAHPFFGRVIIEPKVDASMLKRFYRIDGDGRIFDWLRMPNHIVNLSSGRQFVLFDGSIEEAQSIRWQIKSSIIESIKILQGSIATVQPQEILERRIVNHFTQSHSETKNELICWLKSGDTQFASLTEQFEQARNLATQGKSWIDADGNMLVFLHTSGIKSTNEAGRSQHHSILAIMVQCIQTGSPRHVALFSLSRDKRPALQFHPDSPINQLVASQLISIEFDESRYRWILVTLGPNDDSPQKTVELEYYSAEKLPFPLSHPSGSVTALFSGNLS
jgi:hypothetical protein